MLIFSPGGTESHICLASSGSIGIGPTIMFILIWSAMMIGMMIPSAAPTILMFSMVSKTRLDKLRGYISTGIFILGYIGIMTLSGIVAYLLVLIQETAARGFLSLREYEHLIVSSIFVAAGLYQLSPLKYVCLSRCRSPLSFILNHWRRGYHGALLMGMKSGLNCLACCWALMIILFALGLMNLAWMAIVTLVIFAEKTSRYGHPISKFVGIVFIAWGLYVTLKPII